MDKVPNTGRLRQAGGSLGQPPARAPARPPAAPPFPGLLPTRRPSPRLSRNLPAAPGAAGPRRVEPGGGQAPRRRFLRSPGAERGRQPAGADRDPSTHGGRGSPLPPGRPEGAGPAAGQRRRPRAAPAPGPAGEGTRGEKALLARGGRGWAPGRAGQRWRQPAGDRRLRLGIPRGAADPRGFPRPGER